MSVLRELFATLHKMFAADIAMTLVAVAVVAACGVGGAAIGPNALPFVLTAGVASALIIAVLRGAKR